MKVFYISIDDNTGMDAISLVEHPAVERDFFCFSEDKPMKLEFRDEAEHKISGVVCLADTPIYRNDNGFEYYVVFTKEVIKKMVEKYSKDGLFNSVNLDHNPEKFVSAVYMVESYIKDTSKGISPVGFEDVPEGSWFITFKVDDEDLWHEITTTSHFNGFSLEGFFNMSQYKMQAEEKVKSYDEWVNEFLN